QAEDGIRDRNVTGVQTCALPILLDSWRGLGLLTAGMRRHGYDLSLTSDASGWRATFLHRSHFMQPWVGQVLSWWPTPWQAVQEADRKSTRLNSSHVSISYAVFCL